MSIAHDETSSRIAGYIAFVTDTITIVLTAAEELDLEIAIRLGEYLEAVILNSWVVTFLHVHIRAAAPCVQTRGGTIENIAVLGDGRCRCFCGSADDA